MQVNTEKWGNSSEWLVNTDLSNTEWQDTNLLYYDGKYRTLADYRANGVFDYNTPIDYTICYAAHAAAEKMPLADIALYDYQGNKRGEQTETNGFFFGVNSGISADAWFYFREMSGYINGNTASTSIAGTSMWSPNGVNYSDEYPRPSNLHRYIQPIVQFSPKSAYYVIYVELVSNDYQSFTRVSLKTLKNNIATYAANYYIHRAYMRPYCYNGRVSQDGNYNNYVQKTPNNAGVSTINSIKLLNSDKSITTYEQTIGSQFCLPIMGTVESVHEYRATDSNKYYGCRIAPHDSNNSETWLITVSADKINNVAVTYHRTNAYGNIYLLHTKITITADIVEDIMRGAAAYGLFFSDDLNGLNVDTTNISRWLSENMYCGVLDENGVGHGEYTRGFQNVTNPVFLWDTSTDTPYDPIRPPTPTDPNTYSNTTGFNYITEGAAMTIRYVLDGSNVDKLLSDLWTINANIAQGDFEYFDGKIKDEYLTTNPIDCIVSLIRYPFNIPFQPQPLQSYVKLGKTEGTAKGWTTVYISNQINFQGVDVFPRFGDCFLDYEPYTTYELYVPFCGTTKIRAADILGHTLNLTMLIDLITGSCTAYVKADELVIETLQGSCGIQQQLSGTDTATMNANIYNGILAQKQAKLNMVGTAVNALNPANWINPVNYTLKGEQAEATYKQATYSIEHMETPVHMLSAASPLLGWVQEFNARLMIYYPTGDVITDSKPPSLIEEKINSFGNLNGFSCLKWGKVREFSGFTLGNIKLDGVPCTESERARLKQLFSTGVYL